MRASGCDCSELSPGTALRPAKRNPPVVRTWERPVPAAGRALRVSAPRCTRETLPGAQGAFPSSPLLPRRSWCVLCPGAGWPGCGSPAHQLHTALSNQ